VSDHYILIGQTPVPVEPCDPYTLEGIAGLVEWGRWFEDDINNRVVKQEMVLGLCWVSTVFLGLNHNFMRAGVPILFESMAFWGDRGEEQDRCSTWLEAEAMHARMCADVARPGAVLSYLGRALRSYWKEAAEEWKDLWWELRGKEAEKV